jgi:hypothetical protein
MLKLPKPEPKNIFARRREGAKKIKPVFFLRGLRGFARIGVGRDGRFVVQLANFFLQIAQI